LISGAGFAVKQGLAFKGLPFDIPAFVTDLLTPDAVEIRRGLVLSGLVTASSCALARLRWRGTAIR
jgi:hypothetical protein